MLNKVMIIGRLGRDPELRYTQSGSPVASLNVATDESYTDRDGNKVERTEWHRVSVFQRQAETCANYLSKGSLVYVEGSLRRASGRISRGRIATPRKSKPNGYNSWIGRATRRARKPVPAATRTSTPVEARAARRRLAGKPRATRAPRRSSARLPIVSPRMRISALPSPQRLPTWMKCLFRAVSG